MPRIPVVLRACTAAGAAMSVLAAGSPALATTVPVARAGALVTPTVAASTPAPSYAPIFLNAGGGAVSASRSWSADRGAVGGRPAFTRNAIANTPDDATYQRQRVGMSGYRVPVANGTYVVNLHFAETYFGAAGRRVFSIAAEGATFASRLDVHRLAGKNRAVKVSRVVTVRDGRLDLAFTAHRNLAVLAGIELRPRSLGSPPQQPTTTVSTDGSTATLSWTPGDDGGSPVTAYRVVRTGTDSEGSGAWTTVLPGNARSFVFDKLRPATTYDLLLTTRNAVGATVPQTVTVTTHAEDGTSVTPVPAQADAPVATPATAPVATPATAPVAAPNTAPVTAAPAVAGTWRSGVHLPNFSPAKAKAFGDWRGRDLDVVVDWSARATWSDIVNPSWLYDRWAGTSYTKVLGVAMVPEQDASATIATCARGDHDARWVDFGRTIRDRGLDDETIIRLGWEFNGDWYKWSANDPVAWAACWRRIVTSAESVAPALRWDWTVNRGAGQSLTDPTRAYPGDAYVDVVGVDSYDGWPAALDEAGWQQHYAGAFGLKFWADFARSHGKLLSVPEWGVYPGTAWAGHNGGDNPYYVKKMGEFFRAMGPALAYEAYFNESASYYAGSLHGPVQNPRASEAYASLY